MSNNIIQHYEAVLTDPVARKWAVHRVQSGANRHQTTVTVIAASLRFVEAVNILAAHEDSTTKSGARLLYPDADDMGHTHYRRFAEREGYVFDDTGIARARPAPDALPAGSFHQEDIDRANRHLRRPAIEFTGRGPRSREPNVMYLFDHFVRAVHGETAETRLREMHIVDIMTKYVDYIDDAHKKMQAYKTQTGTGYHDNAVLIDQSLIFLQLAGRMLKQVKAYGVDTRELEHFTTQCSVSAHILHAQGLYRLMNANNNDAPAYVVLRNAFFQTLEKATDIYKTIAEDASDMATLHNIAVQSPHPVVPQAIGRFIANYHSRHTKYQQKYRPRPPRHP